MTGVTLITSAYPEKNRVRRAEIKDCLNRNLANKHIARVVLLAEGKPALPKSAKIVTVPISSRPTFRDMFHAANLYGKGVCVVANSDIYLDEANAIKLATAPLENRVLALSRWDVDKSGKATHYNHPDSQDAWAFLPPLKHIGYADFYMGTLGCDNRIAFEFQNAGYEVLNPSRQIQTFHLHNSGVRRYSRKNKADLVPRPYKICHFNQYNEGFEINKVLHVALNAGGRQIALPRMLKSFGQYLEFDWNEQKTKLGLEKMRQEIIEVSKKFQPDLVFMQLQTPDIIDPHTASQVHGKIINWTGDVRTPIPQWYIDLGRCIDATCFTNDTDAMEMRKMGIGAHYLQIGYDDKVYTPLGETIDAPDIVFLANHYGTFPLSAFRLSIAERLRARYSENSAIYGKGWPFKTENLNGQDSYEALTYRSCKIAINCSHFDYDRYSSDRIYRIMGSGAFCLTKWYPGIEKEFIIGKHLDVFDTLDDMCGKIDHYLGNQKERKMIAAAGQAFVKKNHTWESRKRDIVSILSFSTSKNRPAAPSPPKPQQDKQESRQYAIQQRISDAGARPKFKLSILVPTLENRELQYMRLATSINKQIITNKLNTSVELVPNLDGGQKSIGLKRNELLQMAKGEYVVFVDDDDEVSTDYVTSIFDTLMNNPDVDCVTFDGKVTFNGQSERPYNFLLGQKSYEDVEGKKFMRPPGHLTPIKKSIALKVKFRELPKHHDKGSDVHWAMDILSQGLLKTSVHIAKTLYHYKYVTGKN